MKYYTVGDTAYIKVIHQLYTLSTETWANTDCDATFPKITITDPAGTVKVNAASMTKKATGKYEYLYTIPATPVVGTWVCIVDVENGTYPDRQNFDFGVR